MNKPDRTSSSTCKSQRVGLSKNVVTDVCAAFYANGNNLTLVGDLTRRTLMSRIDAKCERPEEREFPESFKERIKATRAELVGRFRNSNHIWP